MSQIKFLDWLDFYGKLHLSQQLLLIFQLQMSQVRQWPALKRVVYAAYSMRSIQERCHCESTSAQMTHGHILLDDLLNQIGSHLHSSQSFTKFLTLGSKNNCNEIIRIWDLVMRLVSCQCVGVVAEEVITTA